MSVIRNSKHGGHVLCDSGTEGAEVTGGAEVARAGAEVAGAEVARAGVGVASGAGAGAGAETGSMIRNTAHDVHIASILEMALLQGCHSDVTLSVQGSKRVIRCHKWVLAQASPFLCSLLSPLDPQEPAHIHLAGLAFTEAMAMLNLVYVGRVKLASDQQVTSTISAAKSFLGLTVQADPPSLSLRPRKRPLPTRPTPSKRPLLIKAAPGSAPPPVFFVVAPAPPVQGEKVHSTKTGQEAVLPPLDDSEVDFSSLNSYQKAKLRCADKFKCDQCGKGFPLSCLLQRHKKTHSDVKPHGCTYCDKTFSSKTSLNHHMFMQHLEEKSKRLEEGKRLLERLRKVEEGKYTLLGGDGQVMKALTEGGEYILSDREGDGQGKPVEIIGVQDITQQIAVQMEGQQQQGRDTVIQVEEGKYTLLGSLLPQQQQKPKFPGEIIYYSEPETGGYTWEYKT